MRQITFEIPDEVLLGLKVPRDEAGATMRMAVANGFVNSGSSLQEQQRVWLVFHALSSCHAWRIMEWIAFD